MANTNVVYRGAPWLCLTTALLAVLKTTGVLCISWWIVALPMLLPFIAIGAILGVVLALMLGALIVGGVYFGARWLIEKIVG